jgi:hypothetical protein
LRGILRDRQNAVETLLEIKRGDIPEKEHAPPAPAEQPTTRQSPAALKRYRNE